MNDLKASVDESWMLRFALLEDVKYLESFQLIPDAPLIFDSDNIYYFICTEENLFPYLAKERIKFTLHPKYKPKEELITYLDLKLIKEGNVDFKLNFEQVEQNEEIEEETHEDDDGGESGDEEEVVEEEEEEHTQVEKKEKIVYLNCTMELTKLGNLTEYENEGNY